VILWTVQESGGFTCKQDEKALDRAAGSLTTAAFSVA
jgi:hypothetical protein